MLNDAQGRSIFNFSGVERRAKRSRENVGIQGAVFFSSHFSHLHLFFASIISPTGSLHHHVCWENSAWKRGFLTRMISVVFESSEGSFSFTTTGVAVLCICLISAVEMGMMDVGLWVAPSFSDSALEKMLWGPLSCSSGIFSSIVQARECGYGHSQPAVCQADRIFRFQIFPKEKLIWRQSTAV